MHHNINDKEKMHKGNIRNSKKHTQTHSYVEHTNQKNILQRSQHSQKCPQTKYKRREKEQKKHAYDKKTGSRKKRLNDPKKSDTEAGAQTHTYIERTDIQSIHVCPTFPSSNSHQTKILPCNYQERIPISTSSNISTLRTCVEVKRPTDTETNTGLRKRTRER
jgi:hypothetical protein